MAVEEAQKKHCHMGEYLGGGGSWERVWDI